ncbi:MAG: hypothetical protein RBG13Loki_3119 [Promethearchaeota archaeon CR_4]|nr:MAG: hypothetical protein RBG13Loki_3119 [Candidatus Lokiarchaeota archaeon CR_4]
MALVTERPRVLVGIINIYLFDTKEVGLKYENIGPIQLVKILLGVVADFVSDKLDPKRIIEATQIPPTESPNNGGSPI